MNARRAAAAWLLVGLSAGAVAGGVDEGSSTFRLRSVVVAGGGRVMEGAGWRLDGTIGQASERRGDDVGGWRLDEGFWSAAAAGRAFDTDLIFADGFDPPGGAP